MINISKLFKSHLTWILFKVWLIFCYLLQGPHQPGQPFKFTVAESCDRIKEEFSFIQAQYHRYSEMCKSTITCIFDSVRRMLSFLHCKCDVHCTVGVYNYSTSSYSFRFNVIFSNTECTGPELCFAQLWTYNIIHDNVTLFYIHFLK